MSAAVAAVASCRWCCGDMQHLDIGRRTFQEVWQTAAKLLLLPAALHCLARVLSSLSSMQHFVSDIGHAAGRRNVCARQH